MMKMKPKRKETYATTGADSSSYRIYSQQCSLEFRTCKLQRITALFCSIFLIASFHVKAEEKWEWEDGEKFLALKNGEQILWKLNASKEVMKPHFHPLNTVHGATLTEDKPADHVWHHGLWFCFKKINGVSFWEENKETGKSPGYTEVVQLFKKANADFSALIQMEVDYYLPSHGDRLREDYIKEFRTITISPPDETGSYSIDFQHSFKAKQDVYLDRTPLEHEPKGYSYGGYAGLSIRHYGRPGDWQIRDNWKFIASKPVDKLHGSKQKWMAYAGPYNKHSAATAMFDHPSNKGYPNKWYVASRLVYYSPAFLFDKGMELKKDEELKLVYRVRVYSSVPAREVLEKEAKTFGQQFFPVPDYSFKNTEKINLVDVGKQIYDQHCFACHANQAKDQPGYVEKIGSTFYGLLKKSPEKKTVFKDNGEIEVVVDDAYIKSSLHTPELHLAAKKIGETYVPYPPGMPRYDYKGNELQGIIAYMKTLNDGADKGPAEVLVEIVYDEDVNDQFEVIPKDHAKIVRASFKDVSTRAIAVGDPSGVHYIFDPVWFAVRKVWQGGFLNLKVEHTDRGAGINTYGKNATFFKWGDGIRPFLNGEKLVDTSNKDFPTNQSKTVSTLQSDLENAGSLLNGSSANYKGYRLSKSGNPIFMYSIGATHYEQEVTVLDSSSLRIRLSIEQLEEKVPSRLRIDKKSIQVTADHGQIENGVLTIPSGVKQVNLTVSLNK